MNKYIPIGIALAGLALSSAAYAATSVGITLTGTVQQILAITITPTGAATNLDLTANVTNLKVATVKAESNNLAGYNISVTSANQTAGSKCTPTSGPCLYSPVGTGANLPFSLSRNSVNVTFTGPTGQFASSTVRSVLGGDLYDAQVSYSGETAGLPQASNYTETLTFTISNN